MLPLSRQSSYATTVLAVVVLVALSALPQASARGSANSNVCVFQAGAWTSLDSVMQCFYSFPVNLAVKNQTIDALQKALQVCAEAAAGI